MKYVALLRGINVGGKNTVSMAVLKAALEARGFREVSTYINSGNVIFSTDTTSERIAADAVEQCIADTFSLDIPVIVRSQQQIDDMLHEIPAAWTNDKENRTDVMFLWAESDRADIVDEIAVNPAVDTVIYAPGAVVWHFDRAKYKKSKLPNIIGTKVYKLMTGRNITTVRKLQELMKDA